MPVDRRRRWGGDGGGAGSALAELADPAHRLRVRYPSGPAGPAFRVRCMLIWGFTALVVDRLLALGGWERPWDAGHPEDLPPDVLACAASAGTTGLYALGVDAGHAAAGVGCLPTGWSCCQPPERPVAHGNPAAATPGGGLCGTNAL